MTTAIVLVVCGAVAYGLHRLILRHIATQEKIAACAPHNKWLDDATHWAPTYRCHNCPWQEPAKDVLEKRRNDLIERCPKCGGELLSRNGQS